VTVTANIQLQLCHFI